MFVDFVQLNGFVLAGRTDLDDIFGKFPDHIATRYPCRQPEQLAVFVRIAYRHRYPEQMTVQIERFNTILNSLCHGNSLDNQSVHSENRSQPFCKLFFRHVPSFSHIAYLIFPDFPDGEVMGIRMGEIKAGNGCRRQHGV